MSEYLNRYLLVHRLVDYRLRLLVWRPATLAATMAATCVRPAPPACVRSCSSNERFYKVELGEEYQ